VKIDPNPPKILVLDCISAQVSPPQKFSDPSFPGDPIKVGQDEMNGRDAISLKWLSQLFIRTAGFLFHILCNDFS
jgi:hypothetical protein